MASLNSNTRVDASDVFEIFDTDISERALNNWINMAAETVDDIDDADVNDDLSEQRLELIEMNLAAHFASTQDPRVEAETVGDAEFRYKGASEVTDYWRTAAQLDTTDYLSDDGGKPAASINVLDGRGIE